MFMRLVFDEKLAQGAYVFGCQKTGEAIVIDPERDVDRYIDLAREHGLHIVAVAETHIHADFVSGARELAERTGAHVYVSGEGGPDWQSEWASAYTHTILKNDDTFTIGNIEFRAAHTPGHTPEHMVYVVTDRGSGASDPIGVCTGDFLFVGDLGRPDLLETAAGQSGVMEPSAKQLFESAQWLGSLPEFVQVWPGHGAGSACGKALGAVPTSTVGYERRFNHALRLATGDAATEGMFVDFILQGQPEPPLYFERMKRVNRAGPDVLGALHAAPRYPLAKLAELDVEQVAHRTRHLLAMVHRDPILLCAGRDCVDVHPEHRSLTERLPLDLDELEALGLEHRLHRRPDGVAHLMTLRRPAHRSPPSNSPPAMRGPETKKGGKPREAPTFHARLRAEGVPHVHARFLAVLQVKTRIPP